VGAGSGSGEVMAGRIRGVRADSKPNNVLTRDNRDYRALVGGFTGDSSELAGGHKTRCRRTEIVRICIRRPCQAPFEPQDRDKMVPGS
jgi:hypothetical protein